MPQPWQPDDLCPAQAEPGPWYLGDPPGAARGQQLAGGAQAVLGEAGGGRGEAQLGQQQHVIVAVPLGQPRQALALPLRPVPHAQGVAADLGGQLQGQGQLELFP